jgi:hypothetical protein
MPLPATFSDHVTKPLALTRSLIDPTLARRKEREGIRRRFDAARDEAVYLICGANLDLGFESTFYYISLKARFISRSIHISHAEERLKIVECAFEITRRRQHE